jgi:hypothetical protein
MADDPAMPALATRLQALAAAGLDPIAALTAVVNSRELDTADDVAAVLVWRLDRAYGTLHPDPQVATSRAQAASFTARAPQVGGDVGEALATVAHICDQRVRALGAGCDHQPQWATALGPVPADPGRRQ